METVSRRKFQDWAGPAVWVMMLILAHRPCRQAPIADCRSAPRCRPKCCSIRPRTPGVPGIPGSFCALSDGGLGDLDHLVRGTLDLNFCDFSRYHGSSDAKAVRTGNIWGLPVNLILFSLVANVTTHRRLHQVHGEVLLHPDQISAKFDSWFLALLAALTFAVATLGINVVANFVSPAFDFSNVFPRYIDFKKGGYIAALIASGTLSLRALGKIAPGTAFVGQSARQWGRSSA